MDRKGEGSGSGRPGARCRRGWAGWQSSGAGGMEPPPPLLTDADWGGAREVPQDPGRRGQAVLGTAREGGLDQGIEEVRIRLAPPKPGVDPVVDLLAAPGERAVF